MKTLVCLAASLFAATCAAQTRVENIPSSTKQRVFTAITTPQVSSPLRNIGQTVHYLTYRTSGQVSPLQIRIEASNDLTNWFPISADAADALDVVSSSGGLVAYGYFPAVRVNVLKLGSVPGNLTVDYSGTSVAPTNFYGIFNPSFETRRVLARAASADTTATYVLTPPFGSTAGFLFFTNTLGLPASICKLEVFQAFTGAQVLLQTASLQTGAGTITAIPVNAVPSVDITVRYTACGATASLYGLDYSFLPPSIPYQTTGSGFGGEAAFNCSQSVPFTFTTVGAEIKGIIPLATNKIIRVCHISFTSSAAVGVKLVYGLADSNCAGSTSDMTGRYGAVTFLNLNFGNGAALRTTVPSFALCLDVTAATTIGGVISFAQY